MSGTIIESFLFNIECFINPYLPYINVVYDLYADIRYYVVLPAERACQVPELEVEAGGQPVDSSASHKVMTG
jgi:hypothetical protein